MARGSRRARVRLDEDQLEVARDLAPETFEIRRRAGLYVLAAVVPLLLGIAFAVLALVDGRPLLWAPAGVLLVLGVVAASGLPDVRTPLFVADDHGVRLRDGRVWVGLLWSEMDDVRVEGRSGRLDAHVLVVGPEGAHAYAAPTGFTTTASADEVREQLARRRGPASY